MTTNSNNPPGETPNGSLDREFISQLKSINGQSKAMFWSLTLTYVLFFLVGLLILTYSFYMAITQGAANQDQNTYYLGILIGLLISVVTYLRAPIKTNRLLLANMMKMNLVHLGYMRQLRQIDVVFEQWRDAELQPDHLQIITSCGRDALDQTAEEYNQMIEELI